MCTSVLAWLALTLPVVATSVPPSVASLEMRDLAAVDHEAAPPEPDLVDAPAVPPPDEAPAREVEPLPSARARRPHYGLTTIELALALVGGTIWYWRDSDFNSRDWDLGWNRPSWKAKAVTFQAVRFDDNHFDTNAFWHPLDGAGLYLLARGNGLGAGSSLAAVAASSVAWEYLVEYREYPSLNDMIFTSLASISLGEPAIRLAELLRAGSPGPVKRGLATLLDPVGAFNDRFLDHPGGEIRPTVETDAWGLPSTTRHRLDVFVGLGQTDYGAGRQRTEGDFGADLFIDGTPGFGQEGQRWRPTGPGSLTYLNGGAAVDQGSLVAANVTGKVSMVGAQWRSFDESIGPEPHGQSLFLGAATGFEYATRSSPTFSSDRLALVRAAGPMVEGTVARGRFRLDFVTDAAWNFSLVHPFGGWPVAGTAPNAEPGPPVDGIPTVLTREGYYFAHGLSLAARMRAALGRWETGIDVSRDDFRPLGVLDRWGTAALPGISDRRERRRLWVGVRPWFRWPLRAMVTADQWIRAGQLGPLTSTSAELRASTSVGLIF